MPAGGDDEAVLYSAPVLRRSVPMLVVGAIAVAGLVALAVSHGSSTYSSAFTTALFATVIVAGIGFEIVLMELLPTRVDVTATRVRLVAPRALTTYEPGQMVLRQRTDGAFEFVRKRTGRVLARFRAADADAARAAFATAGVEVVA
jgi:hypothetical protein